MTTVPATPIIAKIMQRDDPSPNTAAYWKRRWAIEDRGMYGGEATRSRLASTTLPALGRWERSVHLRHVDWRVLQWLKKYLPPECVAPTTNGHGVYKLRSPRPDVTLAEMTRAIRMTPPFDGLVHQWDELKEILDLPVEQIHARAQMNALQRLVDR